MSKRADQGKKNLTDFMKKKPEIRSIPVRMESLKLKSVQAKLKKENRSFNELVNAMADKYLEEK